MELDIRIKMNDKLYVRNPEETALGKKIVKHGLSLINKLGFEEFTFKKLAQEVDTTEASIYRYFENKHRLLTYIIAWYWAYIEYKVVFCTNNINSAELKLKMIIKLLVDEPSQLNSQDFINECEAYNLVIWEGSKSYLNRHVNKDNKDKLFKSYKDLSMRIAKLVKEYNPKYKFPNAISSTILEMAHSQKFFALNLPSLTDFNKDDKKNLALFLEALLFNAITVKQST